MTARVETSVVTRRRVRCDACKWESLLNPFYSESNAAEHDLVCDYK